METKTDYTKTGKVTLKKEIFSVMFITENDNILFNNADISEILFIEDIFKFCMSGTITFVDRYNMLEYGPYTGNEKIVLMYSIGRKTRELVFDIWKMDKIQMSGAGINEAVENMITLHFVDPFFAGLNLRKYSRSWTDTRFSDIMRDILNNMAFYKEANRKFNIEQSTNKTDFVMPYWLPQTAIRWLGRRAIGSRSGTSGYLCFNNTREGLQHNLVTFNYLLEDVGRTLDRNAYKFQDPEISADNKILEWWMNGIDRTSNNIIRGGVWKGYDIRTKKLLNFDYIYSKGADKTVMLGRKTLYPQMDDTFSSNVVIGDNSNELLENIAYNDWAKRYNLQLIVNLIVEGNEKRYAGQQIDIEWPSMFKTGDKVQYNDLFRGKYLIKSVTHSFSPSTILQYRQRLVCIKNAYHNAKSRILYKAKNTNLYQEGDVQQIIRR